MFNSVFLNFVVWLLFIAAFIEVLTLIHEGGHFLIAKINKVRVAEFAIGFGPVMFQWGKKETKYSIRWFPFGGYVSVLNEDVQKSIIKIREANLDPFQYELAAKQVKPFDPKDDSVLASKPIDKVNWLGKFSFALMGVTFNFLFMFSALWIFAGSMGNPTLDNSRFYVPIEQSTSGQLIISEVTEFRTSDDLDFSDNDGDDILDTYEEINSYLKQDHQSPAYFRIYTDIKKDGQVTSANQYATFMYIEDDYSNLVDVGDSTLGTTVDQSNGKVTLHRNGETEEYYVDSGWTVLIYDSSTNTTLTQSTYKLFNNQSDALAHKGTDNTGLDPYYGETYNVNSIIVPRYTLEHVDSSFVEAWQDTALALTNAVLFTFTFGIVQIDDELPNNAYFDVSTAEKWVMFCFQLFVILSAIMIIFNLLPIPPLDGWKASQWTYEEITGRRMDPIKEAKINKIGWTIVIVYSLAFLFVPLIPG